MLGRDWGLKNGIPLPGHSEAKSIFIQGEERVPNFFGYSCFPEKGDRTPSQEGTARCAAPSTVRLHLLQKPSAILFQQSNSLDWREGRFHMETNKETAAEGKRD